MSSVTIYTYDSADLTRGTELSGVSVLVFSEDGSSAIDSGTTDSSGEVVFELPDETYWVRFFKAGFSFPKKRSIEVDGDGTYDVPGTNIDTRPAASRPDLCRVSGLIIGPGGQYLPNVSIECVLRDETRISAGMATGATKLNVATNANGRVEFDLIRGARYEVFVESYSDPIFVVVPDAAAVGFTDLVWPYVAHVDLSDESLDLTVGDTATVAFTSVLSNGWEGDFPLSAEDPLVSSPVVSAFSTDTSVARVVQSDELEITAVGAGSCEITFVATFPEAYRLPGIPSLPSIAVTVSDE